MQLPERQIIITEEKEKKHRRLRGGKWLGVLVSIFFLYLAFEGLHWKDLLSALKDVKIWILVLGTVIYLTSYFFRGIRWHLMLRSVKAISIWRMTRFVIIGFMTNNLLPARLGEFARSLIIANEERISARSSFASVVLERVFDGVTIVALMLVLILQQPFPQWVKQMGIVATIIFATGFMVLILLGYKGEKLIGIIQRRFKEGIVNKIAEFMLKFVTGLEMLRSKSQIAMVLFLSGVIWSIEVVNYFIVMKSFGIQLTIGAAAFTLVVANLGIMIPSSPGNVGTMQYFMILGLSVYGLTKDISLAYALVLHGLMYLSITILGIYFLYQMGLSFKSIRLTGRDRTEIND